MTGVYATIEMITKVLSSPSEEGMRKIVCEELIETEEKEITLINHIYDRWEKQEKKSGRSPTMLSGRRGGTISDGGLVAVKQFSRKESIHDQSKMFLIGSMTPRGSKNFRNYMLAETQSVGEGFDQIDRFLLTDSTLEDIHLVVDDGNNVEPEFQEFFSQALQISAPQDEYLHTRINKKGMGDEELFKIVL